MDLIWLGVTLALILLEVASVAFFAAFLALGALAAGLLAWLQFQLWVQVVAFTLVSLIGILIGRPLLLGVLGRRREPHLSSGAESMIGTSALLTQAIAGGQETGHVRVLGESWPARSASGAAIAAGETVVVRTIEGATLLVEPLNPSGKEA